MAACNRSQSLRVSSGFCTSHVVSRGVSSFPLPSGGVATGGNWPPFRNDLAKRGHLPMEGQKMVLGELGGSGDSVVPWIMLRRMTSFLG